MLQFPIGSDSQRLEHAGRGLLASFSLKPTGNGRCHRCDQVFRCLQRLLWPPFYNGSRDLTAETFFSVLTKYFFQRAGIGSVDQILNRPPRSHVKSHIQRCIHRVSKSTIPIGQLVGRQTKIEENAIDTVESQFRDCWLGFRITGLFEESIRTRDALPRKVQHHGIAIESNQDAIGTNPLRDLGAMSARTDSAVQNPQPRLQLKLLQDLAEHDRNVSSGRQAELETDVKKLK